MKKITFWCLMLCLPFAFQAQQLTSGNEVETQQALEKNLSLDGYVVDSVDWEVEIIGSYSDEMDCSPSHPTSAGLGGGGSSVDSDFKSATDILVPAGENFTLENIEVPFLTFAPEDAPVTANIVYYEDNAGLPGAMIGSETV